MLSQDIRHGSKFVQVSLLYDVTDLLSQRFSSGIYTIGGGEIESCVSGIEALHVTS